LKETLGNSQGGKKFLTPASWCAQSSASTTARSLRAVRSWVTGPDGLTRATLLAQTRAPSGERLPILHLLGIDHTRLTYKFQGRQFRLTDVHGEVVEKLLA